MIKTLHTGLLAPTGLPGKVLGSSTEAEWVATIQRELALEPWAMDLDGME